MSRLVKKNHVASRFDSVPTAGVERVSGNRCAERGARRASGIKTCCCYGGASKGPQAMHLRDGVHGVIGGLIGGLVEWGRRLGEWIPRAKSEGMKRCTFQR